MLLSPQKAVIALFIYLLPSKDSCFSCVRCDGKVAKTTINFVMSVCPHIIIHLPLDGSSLNFILNIINKICRENSSLVTIGQKYQVLYMKTYIHFTVISGWNIPEIKKSRELCSANHITHFTWTTFFQKSWYFCRIMNSSVQPDRPQPSNTIWRDKSSICMPGNCDKNWQCKNMKYLLLSTGRDFQAKIIAENVIIFKTYCRVVDYSHIII
jgi:hypothetical protein